MVEARGRQANGAAGWLDRSERREGMLEEGSGLFQGLEGVESRCWWIFVMMQRGARPAPGIATVAFGLVCGKMIFVELGD